MEMRVDATLQLAWALANAEANLASSDLIEPIHFFLAALKIADPDIASSLQGVELAEEDQSALNDCSNHIRSYLELSSARAKNIRRSIRTRLRGKKAPQGAMTVLHRSSDARKLFSKAVQLAAEGCMTEVGVMHLVQALFELKFVDISDLGKVKMPDSSPSQGARWRMESSDSRQSDAEPSWPRRDLTSIAKSGGFPMPVRRDSEIQKIIHILAKEDIASALIVGEPGVGKSAVANGVALTLAKHPRTRLRELVMTELAWCDYLAGAGTAAELEGRMREICSTAQEIRGMVLYIDNLFLPTDRIEMLAVPLRTLQDTMIRLRLRVLISCVPQDHERLLLSFPLLVGRMETVNLAEPNVADAADMVRSWISLRYSTASGMRITDSAVGSALRYAKRHILDRRLPESAIDLLDYATAMRRIRSFDTRKELLKGIEIGDAEIREALAERIGKNVSSIEEVN